MTSTPVTEPDYMHRVPLEPSCIWAALAPRVEEAWQFQSATNAGKPGHWSENQCSIDEVVLPLTMSELARDWDSKCR